MLSFIFDRITDPALRNRWDAPPHFRQGGRPKRGHEIEREIAERRLQQMRDAGLR